MNKTLAAVLVLAFPAAARAWGLLGPGAQAAPPAGICLEQGGLDGTGFVLRFFEHPDDPSRRPLHLVLRFAPGACAPIGGRTARAQRVFPGQDYDLVVISPVGRESSAVMLRRHDGSLATFLGRLPDDWLADGQAISLGALWLLERRGEGLLYGTGELLPLPAVPDALSQASR